MMKKRMALFIALIMAVSAMTACAGGTQEPQGAQGAQEGQETQGAQEEVKLTVYMDSGAYLTSGVPNDAVAQVIKEKTGVTLDIVTAETSRTDAIVASGDLYDVTVLDKIEYVSPLIATGSVADLSAWVEKAPNLTEKFPELINYSKEYLSNGSGNLYILPMRAKADSVPLAKDMDGNFIRWDHFVEAGSPELTSEDDLIDLLETIQTNNPENANGKKAYALSAWSDWGKGSYVSPLQKIYGLSGLNLFDSYSLSDYVIDVQ